MSRLSYRVQKLEESIASNDKEVGLGELLHWLYRLRGPRLELDEPEPPLTPDEEREYEDFQLRGETSKFVRSIAAAGGRSDEAAPAQNPPSVHHLLGQNRFPTLRPPLWQPLRPRMLRSHS